ncbi:HAD-IIIC family phosphatase [Oharaeibacter diazotrophicus]|uniref:HAD superfamily phosphatase (TIGR01681 family)/FkbH-like protein n=1 Tax=Oharaeibacter diazotrophicus TaxID=1920512 RepID=A0A4R6RM40_9HYPH|nr:HAD-IIIC family phosphatase [Oharaeibacter diazotrophicus]TDP87592.1 HAD superfamily phosphatase (TIGR01681 family)/FkbH-like protein [Oharaeibacter diazotrophicus]GLS77208.1 hypothetical protein GCM10007904_25450 [Oharaeibacter diazotrophicus]
MNKLDIIVSPDEVDAMFRTILGRPAGNAEFCKKLSADKVTINQLVGMILKSKEFRSRFEADVSARQKEVVFNFDYRIPTDLSVNDVSIDRVAIIGSCLSDFWRREIGALKRPFECDMYYVGQLPKQPNRPISEYDFQIVQIPLRALIPDASFAKLGQFDSKGHSDLFKHSSSTLIRYLDNSMRWNKAHGILSFVMTLPVPQQNLVGRTQPRFELSNPAFFIEKLNEVICQEISKYQNCYVIDFNEILSSYGKKFIVEDVIAQFNHGSIINNYDKQFDKNRIEPATPATTMYYTATKEIILATWHEIISLYRMVRGVDAVKAVVIDLDDTLWRGIVAELHPDEMPTSEGWPKGFWEALLILKRRGIMLAIISKNEEKRVLECWDSILKGQLKIDDFAVHKINWAPKSDNMREILNALNILPNSVVYIDDNPIQRAEIKAAFPDIRVLGGTPARWRHILLHSSETQFTTITQESTKKTEMIKAQIQREQDRMEISSDDFLASLNVQVKVSEIRDTKHSNFSRSLELVNKTNQYNTTGRRWSFEEVSNSINEGMRIFTFDVEDKYTQYGVVGVVFVLGDTIEQLVMSCRVMGMGIEDTMVSHTARIIVSESMNNGAKGRIVETDRNSPCRDIFLKNGFSFEAGVWTAPSDTTTSVPSHVTLVVS